ncbi:MAG TPA: DMT family transporter [Gemmatimonadales bacterium]|jgi:drug/metabolite transporter (DMT)-like permease
MRPAAPPRPIVAGHVALAGAQVAFGLLPIFGTIVFRPGGLSPRVALALAGLLPLLFASGLRSLGAYGFGNLLMVANAFCYSTFLVLTKPLTRRYPTLVILAWAYLFSLVGLVVFLPGQRLVPAPHAAAAWWGIAYIVIFPTIVAYIRNVFALARLRASTTAVYVYGRETRAGRALSGTRPIRRARAGPARPRARRSGSC